MAIVYQHRRLDNNEIFYIGIELDSNKRKATGLRSAKISGRNRFWKSIASKTKYSIEILFKDLTNEESKQVEKYLIKFYGRRDLKLGSLVNLTDGGDGAVGCVQTKEHRQKISKSLKGRIFSTTHKENLSKSLKGLKKNIKYEEMFTVKNKHLWMGENNVTSKKIIDITTGVIYNCLRELSEHSKIKKSTLAAWLNGQNKNKSNYKYLN